MRWLFSFLLATSPVAAAYTPSWALQDETKGWNAKALVEAYFHNSEMQRQWAWELLGKEPLSGAENILDFGCGDGKVSAEIARLVPQGTVTGVDISAEMIHFAHIKFPPYAYPNLAFQQSNSLTFDDIPEESLYDLICSFCVFHLVAHPQKILKSFKEHLTPGGKLMFVVPAGKNPALFRAADEMFVKYQLEAPWKNQSVSRVSPTRTVEGWRVLLQEAGFTIKSLEMIDTDTAFYSREELVAAMMSTTTANWNIPLEVSPHFFEDLVERMCELDSEIIDEEGRVHYKLSRIHVVALSN
ncbi:MAG: class I SAM-dependent methyltransferase [Anaplasmataceae bacterium]|nr:class I SAM-dependent methyltransferase [Anaplasmataceae bacterium]